MACRQLKAAEPGPRALCGDDAGPYSVGTYVGDFEGNAVGAVFKVVSLDDGRAFVDGAEGGEMAVVMDEMDRAVEAAVVRRRVGYGCDGLNGRGEKGEDEDQYLRS